MRLAPLALEALLAALALAACTGGGEPPPAPPEATSTPTPAATPTPTPEASPTPTPTAEATATPTATATAEPTATAEATATPPASPTPDARSGLELIEPAPGAFVRRTFEDGEDIDWEHGVFVLDAETGRTEGYAVAGGEGSVKIYSPSPYTQWHASWIQATDDDWRIEWRLLLDRETGQAWRWPYSALRLAAASEHVLLFENLGADRRSTGRFTLANRGMEEIARFSVAAGDDDWPRALFSPDGSSLVLKVANKVYLVPTATAVPAVLFEEADEWSSIRQLDDGSGIVVEAKREMLRQPDDGSGIVAERMWEKHYFGWDGAEAPGPAPACIGEFPGQLSPDGRYTAELVGGRYTVKYLGIFPLDHPWPSVVIVDAETCAPILRVRSAHTYAYDWDAEWLSTSEGIVVDVLGGPAIARVLPEPALAPLPEDKPWLRPVPAPTGGGRYFGYGLRVYDDAEDRWRGPGQLGGPLDGGLLETESKSWWGDSHRERWFGYPIHTGGSTSRWLQLPPKIELPPFSDETAFRVARTGSCLRLREEPDEESRVLDCLPDGARLLFVERDGEPERYGIGALLQTPHPSISIATPWAAWVRVRTADGTEGWVSDDYLDYD